MHAGISGYPELMGIVDQQWRFAQAAAALIQHAKDIGYEVTLGDAYRDPRVHGDFGEKKAYGRARSCHKMKLAIDLNLFKDGEYLATTDAHRPLGEWWEETYEGASWGGHFNDGNHYSFEFQGSR